MKYNPSLSDGNISRLGDKKQEVIDLVIRDFARSEDVLNEWKNKIVKYYDLYQLVQKNKHYSGLAKIFVPETLRAVETVVAKLYGMIFAQPDWFEFYGRDNNGDEGAALALTQLTSYQMEQNSFKARVMDSLRQMVIAGLTVRKIGWDYQEVKRRLPGQDENGKSNVRYDTVKDTWTFEPVDLLTFHISDINIPYNDVQKAEWIGEQYIANKEWVKARTRRGWFSAVMEKELYNDDKVAASSRASENVDSRLNSSGFNNITKKGKCELLERWGLVPCEWVMEPEQMAEEGLEEGDLVEGVIVVGNRCAIIKLEVNPFSHGQKPYVVCPYIPKEFELPGMGVAQIAESLQEEINDTRNQTMDNKTLVLSTMWLKSRASGIKNSDLTIRPNGVINTNDMKGLEALRPPIVTNVGNNMEGISKNDLRESAGAASNLQGIAQAGVGTATEASTINRESLSRLFLTAQLYAELVIRPTLIFAEFLNYQYYDHVKVIKIIGPNGVKFKKLSPDEIKDGLKDVSVKISLDATENPSIVRQQLMNFLAIVQPMPPEQMAFHWKLLDKMYGMFFNGHTLDELYPNPNVDPAKLLGPEDERDMILAEQPVLAQKGQDHKEFIMYHEQEYQSMRLALSDLQLGLYQKLILSHYELLNAEMAELQAQFMAQTMLMGNSEKPGNMIDRGRSPNTTPFNQKSAPSTESQRKELGG